MSAWFRLDFQPGAGIIFAADQRPAFRDKFNSFQPDNDRGFAVNGGISLKF